MHPAASTDCASRRQQHHLALVGGYFHLDGREHFDARREATADCDAMQRPFANHHLLMMSSKGKGLHQHFAPHHLNKICCCSLVGERRRHPHLNHHFAAAPHTKETHRRRGRAIDIAISCDEVARRERDSANNNSCRQLQTKFASPLVRKLFAVKVSVGCCWHVGQHHRVSDVVMCSGLKIFYLAQAYLLLLIISPLRLIDGCLRADFSTLRWSVRMIAVAKDFAAHLIVTTAN